MVLKYPKMTDAEECSVNAKFDNCASITIVQNYLMLQRQINYI